MKHSLLFLPLIALFLISCGREPAQETGKRDFQREETQLRATENSNWTTFQGNLPCADCAGIELDLRLEGFAERKEGNFDLYETFEGTYEGDKTVESYGTYEYQSGREPILTLKSEDNQIRRFVHEENGDLTLLDLEGKRIQSTLNYSLKRKN
jgi:copper homeostasis protein (lipoprotein)